MSRESPRAKAASAGMGRTTVIMTFLTLPATFEFWSCWDTWKHSTTPRPSRPRPPPPSRWTICSFFGLSFLNHFLQIWIHISCLNIQREKADSKIPLLWSDATGLSIGKLPLFNSEPICAAPKSSDFVPSFFKDVCGPPADSVAEVLAHWSELKKGDRYACNAELFLPLTKFLTVNRSM